MMAANTRYEAAPQRDSFEDQHYTQAPPSYQAAAEYPEPRTEGDNLPDDFKFGGTVAEGTIEIRMQFVRKVYSILTAQILLTTILSSISFFNASYRTWIQSSPWLLIISVFGAIGFMLATFWKRKSYPQNLIFLSAFTLMEAYSISVATSFYEARYVVQALILTLGIFAALTIFACQTKYDFTNWAPYLFGALWFMLLFGFVAMFVPFNSAMETAYCVIGALIFCGYIIFDTQMVMRHHHVEEEIAAAISLYLDVLNLFMFILRILNNQNNN
ncbi:Bax inhibitor 1-like protein [Penicillium hispanicum]|uniref:Bax inhibitor 1-like protein n=1 Tax=Penicillium hispanicum TaxID=1080232 RepID=UPI0025405614|nr:Bax inhibitor 1-like protein [Penicillium hispanicum]KAJ5573712.1 Bax inhibitor 1-like protein [Penicillium hispanicum]